MQIYVFLLFLLSQHYKLCYQGRINHGAKRAMAQGPPAVRGPPRHQEIFRLFNCHLYRELFD